MFINKNYILANELIEKMDIHISNISVLKQSYENVGDYHTFLKMNNCTFINSKSKSLPYNIRVGISENEFTDLSDKLPSPYIRTEFHVNEMFWFNSGIVIEKIKISGKQFYVFDPEFVKKMKGKIPYILDEAEARKCKMDGDIEGYTQLSRNQYFTWYSVGGGILGCELIGESENEVLLNENFTCVSDTF